jgi:hypothetical protein
MPFVGQRHSRLRKLYDRGTMRRKVPAFAGDDPARSSPPLTQAELVTIRRADADIAAGRLRSHVEVARWLRKRAAEIINRASSRAQLR